MTKRRLVVKVVLARIFVAAMMIAATNILGISIQHEFS